MVTACFSLSGIHCVELTQTDSMVLSPGQVLTLSCKISGYSVTDSSYCTHFIRQPAGKALEWVGVICSDGSTYYSDKLKSRFQVTCYRADETWDIRIHLQAFIPEHSRYRQGQTVANRYIKDEAENSPKASVGRRSANLIQWARQRE